jgi:23S rRNA (adenine2030-N6)-methyltransferase
MLAYRHAFHAGNHADVLKHISLMLVLRHMNQKDKPYRYIDTHAGAGGYSLEGRYAQKKGEYEQGIERLWAAGGCPSAAPAVQAVVADYLALVKQFNADGKLHQYPGSPAVARMLLRDTDPMACFEMHPTDERILSSYLGDRKHTQVMQADGFEGLKSLLPPPSRRAVVLMDPSYEIKADYGRVVASLRDALGRFADGVYMLWYPQVQKVEAAGLPKRLQAMAPKSWLHARLTVQQPDSQGFGLAGSGVFIFNPPYTLHEQLSQVLPALRDSLAQYEGAQILLDHRAA